MNREYFLSGARLKLLVSGFSSLKKFIMQFKVRFNKLTRSLERIGEVVIYWNLQYNYVLIHKLHIYAYINKNYVGVFERKGH